MLNTFTLASLLAQLFLAALSSEGTCTTGTGAGNCKEGACNVQIGSETYCSKCATDGEGPIDGICKAKGSNTCAGGACQSCTAGYFLHKGGCYAQATTPGSTICKTVGSTAGVCEACQAGYFKNPANSNQKDSCIACGDTTGDTTNGNKGVQNCATCTVEGAGTTGKTAKCTTCVDGYFANSDGSACGACDGNANCATCSGAATQCTSCKGTGTKLYFKKGSGETGECVAEAACKDGTHFPTTTTDSTKICASCSDETNSGIADCATCTKESTTLKCLTCTTQTNKPNKAGSKCFDCQVTDCSHCSANGVCEACSGNKKVSPGGSSCVTACPDNSSDQSGVCVCNSGFAPSGDTCVPTGPNLSTGAIAGISVAAVVVVGGLVGFLCWWFVCRGKA